MDKLDYLKNSHIIRKDNFVLGPYEYLERLEGKEKLEIAYSFRLRLFKLTVCKVMNILIRQPCNCHYLK